MSDSVDEPGRPSVATVPGRVVGERPPTPIGFWASASTVFFLVSSGFG
jgi:hypothetical protein